MSYEHLRRSSRIPKEVAILLTGSDMDGKGFSEMTKTVLLSRHGGGIISTYKLSAEQEIIIRYLDTNKEALVRVVGRIGSEGEIYTYGVAFVDTLQYRLLGHRLFARFPKGKGCPPHAPRMRQLQRTRDGGA